ncbi:hypothetical protein AOZ06_04555 [Kibdelosporangium phytohabitans]|uniref:Methyltransferase type 12 n=1 Tax=Kibdelosporangium phytohabitans TaxID=860235 RepID=A0A0N9HSX4_9PSEU|nr:hypothetical protein AOZ06_04555 [Kibdelosporangium phytohabitans]
MRDDCFRAALTGTARVLELSDGRRLVMNTQRWHTTPTGADRWLVNRCHGPTIDLGCGPGRFVEALQARDIPALGVDTSDHAVAFCRDKGVPVVQADVFAPLPREGQWQHVLLADGNIGIGGNPLALLHRAASLLTATGSLLLEIDAVHAGLWRGSARIPDHDTTGAWFPWAMVGLDAVAELATRAGLRLIGTRHAAGRCFARIGRHLP